MHVSSSPPDASRCTWQSPIPIVMNAVSLNCICCKHVNHVFSLQVEGNLIKWQKWQIRTSFNYREGLVLHNVG